MPVGVYGRHSAVDLVFDALRQQGAEQRAGQGLLLRLWGTNLDVHLKYCSDGRYWTGRIPWRLLSYRNLSAANLGGNEVRCDTCTTMLVLFSYLWLLRDSGYETTNFLTWAATSLATMQKKYNR